MESNKYQWITDICAWALEFCLDIRELEEAILTPEEARYIKQRIAKRVVDVNQVMKHIYQAVIPPLEQEPLLNAAMRARI